MSEDIQPSATDGLGRRAVGGATVTVVGQFGRLGLQLVSTVVLARLLQPDDFGLFAMVMSIAGLAEVFRDFGLSQAAIQAPTLSRFERDNLFWLNSAIGAVLAIFVALLSWPIAAFYDRPDLAPVAQVIAVVFLINGVSTQLRASLSRSLRFAALVVIDISSAFVGLLAAIAFAVADTGVWALAAQFVCQSLAALIATVLFAGWLPRLPRRRVPIRKFLRFGFGLFASQLVGYAGNNLDSVVIGSRLGAESLGFYNRGFQLVMTLANQLRAPIASVAIPILSKLQNTRPRYWEFARLGQIALGYTVVVALGLFIGAAVPLTELLLGPGWTGTASVIALLGAAAIFQTLNSVSYWVYVSLAKTRILFNYNLVSVAIKVACILIGSTWGVLGVAGGYAVAAAISWPISLIWIARAVPGVPAWRIGWAILRMSLVSGFGALCAYMATVSVEAAGAWTQLGAAVLGLIAGYAIAALCVPAVRRDIGSTTAALALLRHRAA